MTTMSCSLVSIRSSTHLGDSACLVADRHHHIPGTDAQSGTLHGIALQQLEVFLHVLLSQGMLAPVEALGDREDQEKSSRKTQSGNRGDRLGEQIEYGSAEQHQKDGKESNRQLVAGDG